MTKHEVLGLRFLEVPVVSRGSYHDPVQRNYNAAQLANLGRSQAV
jgi:hypothetical protein